VTKILKQTGCEDQEKTLPIIIEQMRLIDENVITMLTTVMSDAGRFEFIGQYEQKD
jgi:hypothetical protein